MWLLATYADGDGTRIFPTAASLAVSMGLSKRTIFNLLDNLKTCGFLETAGYHGENGPRIRAIKIESLQAAGVQPSIEQACNLVEAGVQPSTSGVQPSTSGVQPSIALRPPAVTETRPTHIPPNPWGWPEEYFLWN
jgi:hypothetical protein